MNFFEKNVIEGTNLGNFFNFPYTIFGGLFFLDFSVKIPLLSKENLHISLNKPNLLPQEPYSVIIHGSTNIDEYIISCLINSQGIHLILPQTITGDILCIGKTILIWNI